MDPASATVVVAGIAAISSVINTWLTRRQNQKLDETHRQVTVNGHRSEEPTVLDHLSEIRAELRGLNYRVSRLETRDN